MSTQRLKPAGVSDHTVAHGELVAVRARWLHPYPEVRGAGVQDATARRSATLRRCAPGFLSRYLLCHARSRANAQGEFTLASAPCSAKQEARSTFTNDQELNLSQTKTAVHLHRRACGLPDRAGSWRRWLLSVGVTWRQTSRWRRRSSGRALRRRTEAPAVVGPPQLVAGSSSAAIVESARGGTTRRCLTEGRRPRPRFPRSGKGTRGSGSKVAPLRLRNPDASSTAADIF